MTEARPPSPVPTSRPAPLGSAWTATPPRVLVVHNRYQQPGGEDVAFEAEAALLEAHGHPVDRLEFSNDDIPPDRSLRTTLQLTLDTIWSRSAARTVAERARHFRADIVHFHNTLPLVSPAAFRAARHTGAAVVASLHNYRAACPSATIFRDGHRCTDCVGKLLPWPGILHACYRDSRPQTAVVAAMLTTHRLRRTFARDVDLFLTPSEATRAIVAEHLPPDRILVKPNFTADPGAGLPPDPSAVAPPDTFLYVGRLTVEKGVPTLLDAWSTARGTPPAPLTIVGDGPLRPQVERAAAANPYLSYLGQVDRPTLLRQLRRAHALVIPSLWDEPFGLVAIEAYAASLPVIAARTGALPEIVEDGVTGLLVSPGSADDLSRAATRLVAQPDLAGEMASAARARYEARYTPEANYDLLATAYHEAIQHRDRTTSGH